MRYPNSRVRTAASRTLAQGIAVLCLFLGCRDFTGRTEGVSTQKHDGGGESGLDDGGSSKHEAGLPGPDGGDSGPTPPGDSGLEPDASDGAPDIESPDADAPGVSMPEGGPDAEAAVPVCGNQTLEDGELCDDGNLTNTDGCESNCTPTRIQSVGIGRTFACALLSGRVKCWGINDHGQLGYVGEALILPKDTPTLDFGRDKL